MCIFVPKFNDRLLFFLFQVTFLTMPLEIGWASTVSWEAGDAMCRIMAFFRTFGLYLSSFVLICISVDRLESDLESSENSHCNSDKKYTFVNTHVMLQIFCRNATTSERSSKRENDAATCLVRLCILFHTAGTIFVTSRFYFFFFFFNMNPTHYIITYILRR